MRQKSDEIGIFLFVYVFFRSNFIFFPGCNVKSWKYPLHHFKQPIIQICFIIIQLYVDLYFKFCSQIAQQ